MTKAVRLFLPDEMVKGLDELVEAGKFGNRSEAIRAGIRELLRKWGEKK